MKKTIKYIGFTFLVCLITLSINIGSVDAASCDYKVVMDSLDSGFTLQTVSEYSSSAVLKVDKSKAFGLGNSVEINKEFDVTLQDGQCPTITLYRGWNGIYVYQTKKQCTDTHPNWCNKASHVWDEVSGTLVLEDGEKRQCSTQESQEYVNATLPYFKEIEAIDKYKERLNKIDLKNTTQCDVNINEINKVIDDYTRTFTDLSSALPGIMQKYDCDLGQKANDDIVAAEKLYNVYINTLKTHKDELINKATQEIKQGNGDASCLTKTKENTNQHIDESKKTVEEKKESLLGAVSSTDTLASADCSTLDDIRDHIQTVFNWIKIIAPILLIVFGCMDFGKAVVQNDEAALKKATSNFIKRAIATVAIFFLPLIINVLLHLPGIESSLEDALCGISKVVIK